MDYDYVLSGQTVRFLLGGPTKICKLAVQFFEKLADNPFIEGDF